MAQLHLSVDAETAAQLAEEADLRGLSLSKYLAELLQRAMPSRWPKGYLDAVIGSCADAPLEVPEDVPIDEVDL